MRRLVFIEETENLAEVSAALARTQGYDGRPMGAHPEILETLHVSNADVIFCHVSMPDPTGLALGRAMRLDPALQGAYLVAVIGYESQAYRALAESAGYDDCCVRPIDAECMSRIVTAANQKRSVGGLR